MVISLRSRSYFLPTTHSVLPSCYLKSLSRGGWRGGGTGPLVNHRTRFRGIGRVLPHRTAPALVIPLLADLENFFQIARERHFGKDGVGVHPFLGVGGVLLLQGGGQGLPTGPGGDLCGSGKNDERHNSRMSAQQVDEYTSRKQPRLPLFEPGACVPGPLRRCCRPPRRGYSRPRRSPT